jgi:hypothetical protein
MKRVVFSILAVGLLITTVCNGASVMTMTTSSNNVKIRLAGSGAVTIDWGDGSEIVTANLQKYKWRWWHKREYSYNYADDSSRTLTITGEYVTHMCCDGNHLTNLDVSNNTALTFLECNFCQLTSLDISKNVELSWLKCMGNSLTILDVSKNTALIGLNCSMNMGLKDLDVSNNIALTRLSFATNPLNADADALNNLFGTLNNNAGKKIILITSESEKEVNYDKSIAMSNGWEIKVVDIAQQDGRKKVWIPDLF